MICNFALSSMAQLLPISHITTNNVNATILGNGMCSLLRQQADASGIYPCPAWEVPVGSGKQTISEQSLWLYGLDDNDSLHCNSFPWSGPLKTTDASTDLTTILKYHRVWSLSREEVDHFVAHHGETGYEIPKDILTWPAHGEGDYAQNLAPFVDMDGDGHYNPEAGDYPDIKGDQCLFFIFNDMGYAYTELEDNNIGLEAHAMVYAYNAPDDEPFNNTVFFSYKFFNRSTNNYHDVYLGLETDWDIGYLYDDYVGCDVQRGSCFAYNSTPIDGASEPSSYGDNPPIQVLTVLAGPYLDADGRDNPAYNNDCEALFNTTHPSDKYAYNGFNFGNGIADDERMGLTGFFFHHYINPDYSYTSYQIYNRIRCLWDDGRPLLYGGDGYNLGTLDLPCKFMYPGNSDPCNWGTNGEQPEGYGNNGIYWTDLPPDYIYIIPENRIGIASVGPFSFPAGGMQELDYAMTTVWKNESQSAMDRKGEFIDHIRTLFNNGLTK